MERSPFVGQGSGDADDVLYSVSLVERAAKTEDENLSRAGGDETFQRGDGGGRPQVSIQDGLIIQDQEPAGPAQLFASYLGFKPGKKEPRLRVKGDKDNLFPFPVRETASA